MAYIPIKLRPKNQMTLPAEVSNAMGVEIGDTLYLKIDRGQYVLVSTDGITDPTAGALAEYSQGKPRLAEDQFSDTVSEGILENWERFVRETEAVYDK